VKLIIALAALFFISSPSFALSPVCGTSDDTPAIQAAFDAGGLTKLPSGVCKVCSLNGTNRPATLQGDGIWTAIFPICSGMNLMDFTGSGTVTVRDFHICGTCTPGIVPKIGILTAFSDVNTADVFTMDKVRIDGSFSTASLFIYQTASSSVSASQIYNYKAGAVTTVMTGNISGWGVSSAFATINPLANSAPSDWTFTAVEQHNLGSGNVLWIGGANSIRFFGGNLSSSGLPVSINAVPNSSGGVTYPGNIMFSGTTFYSDFPPTPPCAIQNNAGAPGAPILQGNQITMATKVC
jgi:hypothetical protein